MKKIIFIILFALMSMSLNAQTNISNTDTVINLKEVTVYAKQGLFILKSNNRKGSVHVSVKGKTYLVTRVDIDKNSKYNIDALGFFFNYQWQGIDGEGFYIKPLILTSENGRPGSEYLESQKLYFVSKKINKEMYIDLSRSKVLIENANSFFVGIEFVATDEKSKFEDFNITLVPLKKSLNTSFIKGSCPKCKYSPLNLDKKNGLSLKYNIYYKR